MMRVRTVSQVEADLASLRKAAERAGIALACAFEDTEQYEEAMHPGRGRQRRAMQTVSHPLALLAGLVVVFLLI